jgi:hypothetical protein
MTGEAWSLTIFTVGVALIVLATFLFGDDA